MATLHLMCGLPCSGKTTRAKQLELEHSALRLTPDEWHTRLYGQDALEPEHDDRHNLIESMLWEVAARILSLETNVILDFGFWGKWERDNYRSWAAEVGASSEIHFLDVPNHELLERLKARNTQLPEGAFKISEAQLKAWMGIFEVPSADELERREVV
ncbi:MAG: AAA family ATPase [Deinococcota bacterium]